MINGLFQNEDDKTIRNWVISIDYYVSFCFWKYKKSELVSYKTINSIN